MFFGSYSHSSQCSDCKATANLDKPRIQHRQRPKPCGAIGVVDRQCGTIVEQVVDVEIRAQANPWTNRKHLGQAEVEQRLAWFELCLGSDEGNTDRCGTHGLRATR